MKLPRRKFLRLAAGVAVLPAVARIAAAQTYPSRPIRLVIPFPPGGAFDTLGRPWADKMKLLLGTVVVENIGGGGASLGAAAVARARPDGYTILLGGTLPHVNEALLKSRPLYDPVKDLDPIAAIAANFTSIAVHPSVPARTLGEWCRQRCGWNLARRDLRSPEGIVSGCEVNWLIDGLCGERLPAIDFAHVDLA